MGLLAAIVKVINSNDLKGATPEKVIALAVRSEIEKERQEGLQKHN